MSDNVTSEQLRPDEIARLDEYERLCANDIVPDEHNGLWWLSFADDDGFRGAALVFADSLVNAIREAHVLRINPGGEVMGIPVPGDIAPGGKWIGRLLSADECRELDEIMCGGNQ